MKPEDLGSLDPEYRVEWSASLVVGINSSGMIEQLPLSAIPNCNRPISGCTVVLSSVRSLLEFTYHLT